MNVIWAFICGLSLFFWAGTMSTSSKSSVGHATWAKKETKLFIISTFNRASVLQVLDATFGRFMGNCKQKINGFFRSFSTEN
jgi:hypothetical protein